MITATRNTLAKLMAKAPKSSVDTTEIDDLFSVFQQKKPAVEAKVEPSKKEPTEKETKNEKDTESDSDTDYEEDSEDEQSDPEKFVSLKKGTLYDANRDDFAVQDARAKSDDDSDFFDSRGRKRKARPLTEDGLPIYTTKELRIGLGGDTDLCPFDCNCCY